MSAGPSATGESSSSAGGGGLSGKIILALSALNILITAGMVGVLFVSFQREKQKPSIEDISTHPQEGEKAPEHGEHGEAGKEGAEKEAPKKNTTFGRMVALEPFTVNLSTPGSVNAKYVRVSMSIEVSTEEVETEVGSKIPQVRNAIIDLFNSKRPSDLAAAEGREYLKEEIKNALNSFLVSGKVKGVFFTSFALAG